MRTEIYEVAMIADSSIRSGDMSGAVKRRIEKVKEENPNSKVSFKLSPSYTIKTKFICRDLIVIIE